MRVAGEDRPVGVGEFGGDRPAVAALVPVGGQGSLFLAGHGLAGLPLLVERDVAGGEPVGVQDVAGHRARVQALGQRGRVLGFHSQQQVGVAELVVAGHLGAGEFAREVPAEGVRTDADDVLGLPVGRVVTELAELGRHVLGVVRQPVDVGVDALGEACGGGAGLGAVAVPLLVHVAPVQEQARGTVAFHELGAQDLGELAQPLPTVQVDLEEPVAGRVDPLGVEEVLVVVGADVRDPGGVDGDGGLAVQAGKVEFVAFGGCGAGPGQGQGHTDDRG